MTSSCQPRHLQAFPPALRKELYRPLSAKERLCYSLPRRPPYDRRHASPLRRVSATHGDALVRFRRTCLALTFNAKRRLWGPKLRVLECMTKRAVPSCRSVRRR